MLPDRRINEAPEAAGRPLEAAGLPEGTITLAEALEKLVAELPALRDALKRQADRRPEPLVFRKAEAAAMCGMSTRTWERLLSAGKAPRPDAYARKCPLWKKSTLQGWIDKGGARA